MSELVNIQGQRFGMLTVKGDSGQRQCGSVMWLCVCDCGNEVLVNSYNLRKGRKKSCGCYRGTGNLKHGMSKTRLYRIWESMITRCTNKANVSYKLYGAKGVTICDEWRKFQPFAEWSLSHGYDDTLTIDRIDNSKGYEPSNCRWVDLSDQANNRSCTLYFEKDGQRKPLAKWCKELGVDYRLVYNRVHKMGWSFERAISEPVHKEHRTKQGSR